MNDEPKLSASDQAFAEQWAHLWPDSADVDTSPSKPCRQIPCEGNEVTVHESVRLIDDATEGPES